LLDGGIEFEFEGVFEVEELGVHMAEFSGKIFQHKEHKGEHKGHKDLMGSS
jgi:hypothetical protein